MLSISTIISCNADGCIIYLACLVINSPNVTHTYAHLGRYGKSQSEIQTFFREIPLYECKTVYLVNVKFRPKWHSGIILHKVELVYGQLSDINNFLIMYLPFFPGTCPNFQKQLKFEQQLCDCLVIKVIGQKHKILAKVAELCFS